MSGKKVTRARSARILHNLFVIIALSFGASPFLHAQSVLNHFAIGGSRPGTIAVDSKTNTLYVADSGCNAVLVIDGTTHKLTDMIPVPLPVNFKLPRIALNPNTGKLYIVCQDGQVLQIIDTRTRTLLKTDYEFITPSGVAVNSKTNTVYITDKQTNTVAEINGATDTVSATICIVALPVLQSKRLS